MDVVMGTANPNRAIVAQLGTAQGKPLAVELVDVFRCATFVPIALIDTYLLAAMHADAAITEKIRRIGKDGINGVILYLCQPFHAIALQNSKIGICAVIYRHPLHL